MFSIHIWSTNFLERDEQKQLLVSHQLTEMMSVCVKDQESGLFFSIFAKQCSTTFTVLFVLHLIWKWMTYTGSSKQIRQFSFSLKVLCYACKYIHLKNIYMLKLWINKNIHLYQLSMMIAFTLSQVKMMSHFNATK